MEIDTAEQMRMRYRWIFAIVNSATEERRIRGRILEQMAPSFEFVELMDYIIPKSRGLHCTIFSFSSEQSRIENPLDIYANLSRFRRDRSLVEMAEEGLIHYAERLVA